MARSEDPRRAHRIATLETFKKKKRNDRNKKSKNGPPPLLVSVLSSWGAVWPLALDSIAKHEQCTKDTSPPDIHKQPAWQTGHTHNFKIFAPFVCCLYSCSCSGHEQKIQRARERRKFFTCLQMVCAQNGMRQEIPNTCIFYVLSVFLIVFGGHGAQTKRRETPQTRCFRVGGPKRVRACIHTQASIRREKKRLPAERIRHKRVPLLIILFLRRRPPHEAPCPPAPRPSRPRL